ncbi:hypothetical protein DL98DRAFT_572736 [Cadophora sp. DSE1049]|nr:hypothetical protein DL98DRAFT_572736 [Cadophora sp. DSE1049]
MYLQFCPVGDLTVLMNPAASTPGTVRKPFILEEDLWDMFYCLSLAVSVMARGAEDAKSPAVLHGLDTSLELVPYDITVDNVLIGNRDPDHERYPILVMGDFESAAAEPKNASKGIQEEVRVRDAPGWTAPENKEGPIMRAPRKGTCSNIFQIGLLMHALIHCSVRYPAILPKHPWKPPFSDLRYTGKFTYGTDLFNTPWKDTYSATLRELVMHCLMYEPLHRVGVQELHPRVATGRRACREAKRDLKEFDKQANAL